MVGFVGEGRRRLLVAALRAPPTPPDPLAGEGLEIKECAHTALLSAGLFGILSSELVTKVLTHVSQYACKGHLGSDLHTVAVEASEHVRDAALACRYLLWVFRSASHRLRLEVVGRLCTALTPSTRLREAEADGVPYYNQVLREERSRFHVRIFESAVNALVCHCTGEHCTAARRNHNLTISAPSQARTEVQRRAVGDQRSRVKAVWRPRSRRVAVASEANAAVVLLETEELRRRACGIEPQAQAQAQAHAQAQAQAQARAQHHLFGPPGYLPLEPGGDADSLRSAIGGVLVVENATRSEAMAQYESRPTHAIALFDRKDLSSKPAMVVAQLRLSACGEWLVTCSSTRTIVNIDPVYAEGGYGEVRVFPLREKKGMDAKGQVVARTGGLAFDLYSNLPAGAGEESIGKSFLDAWFLDGAKRLAVLDCSDVRRGLVVCPRNGDMERHPVLTEYSYEEHNGAGRFRARKATYQFARIAGCNDNSCDHSGVDWCVSSSGTGVVCIWNWQFSPMPGHCGINVQHYDLRRREWEPVSRSRENMWFGHWVARRVAITPHSDTIVVLMQTFGAQELRIDVCARARANAGRSQEYDGVSESEFGPPYALLKRIRVSPSTTPARVSCSSCLVNISPCGRFVLYVFRGAGRDRDPERDRDASGGIYVIDLGECADAATLQTVWIPALSCALPTSIAWNGQGLWLQTHLGVLLVGT
jgi:hypothetical protein